MTRPLVMLGEFTGRRVPRIEELGWGRMWMCVDRRLYTYPGEPWGFDNAMWRFRDRPFDGAGYTKRLMKVAARVREMGYDKPAVAIVPDKVAGGMESLALSSRWLPICRELADWPWYLAVQDGMTRAAVLEQLPRFDGIFLGGSSEWKERTAGMWCATAHEMGKRFHYGRAGTIEKLEQAHAIGADSLDSAFPMWTDERWRRFEDAWLALGPNHPQLQEAA